MCVASFGRCSLISMPVAEVLIGLNSPAPLLSGLRSRVSLWLAPPSDQTRMQFFAFFADGAAAWARFASTPIHPESATEPTPREEAWRNRRRVA